jgi:hypothetical protein
MQAMRIGLAILSMLAQREDTTEGTDETNLRERTAKKA